MKRVNIVAGATALLTLSLALTGYGEPSRNSTTPASNTPNSTTQAVESVASRGNASNDALQQKTEATFEDAKLYCLGIILYSQEHANFCATNLAQTLPYLHAANRVPSGTNHFEILYHGSLDRLPNPMTNDIVLIRSDSWQESNQTWARIYGFADGHCGEHSEPDGNFVPWETQHLLSP